MTRENISPEGGFTTWDSVHGFSGLWTFKWQTKKANISAVNEFSTRRNSQFQRDDAVVFGDLAMESTELKFRCFTPGDSIQCWGRGRRKVSLLFKEFRIPRSLRENYPVLCLGEEVIWVPGICRSELCPVLENTQNMLLFHGGFCWTQCMSMAEVRGCLNLMPESLIRAN
jgi:tRNA(Ile)-lysidine synthetase-like protein